VAMLRCCNQQVASLEQQVTACFAAHPDATILRSLPGLGVVLGARVLGEFGDDPHRYATAKGRKAFAGTAPVTRSSGLRTVVVAWAACNQRLVDACYLWAFAALSAPPGALRYYDAHRRPWRHPPPGAAGAGQPAGGDLARLPCSPGRLPGAAGLAGVCGGRLTGKRGGPGGATPPAILASWVALTFVVQLGRRCREQPSPGDQQPRPDRGRLQRRQQRHLGPDATRRGFLLDRGRYVRLDVPGALKSQAFDINDRGQVVGDYMDADGRFHGYVWERGRFKTIDVPGQSSTAATGINNHGQVTGGTGPFAARVGFLLDRGRFTTFTIPGAQATLAYGINDQGQIVGHSISGPTPLTISGFLRDAPGAPHRDQPARRRRHRALRHQQPRPDRGPRRQPLGPDPAQPTDPAPMGRIA
jgi:Transposase IS116/IS110/IS902 family